jgi:hypothetical protein
VTGQWNASSGSTTLTVTGAKPPATIVIVPVIVTYPNNSPIGVQLTPPSGQNATPTGTVSISIDGTSLGQLQLNPAGGQSDAFFSFLTDLAQAADAAQRG